MQKLETMKAVYCYFFPEVRALLREVESKQPDEMFLVSTSAKQVEESLEALFKEPLKIPETIDGKVDLDTIQEPIMKRITEIYSSAIPNLENFNYSYPTSGSSEGIFHLLTKLKVEGVDSIYVLKGEYEGYEAQANNLGMKVNVVDPDKTDIENIKPGYWFISNPSARDGNIIQNEFIEHLCELDHKIVLDFAYVGTTKPYGFNVDNKNIIAAVMSFSKPYGVFRFRIGGFTFSREEVPSLYGNKWFKDTTRMLQALKIAEDIGPEKLHSIYKSVQEDIISGINKEFGIGMKASDSFLLGYLKDEDTLELSESQIELIKPFKRGNGYRFCLTPYFERYEQERLT